jgi:hypothetical protein
LAPCCSGLGKEKSKKQKEIRKRCLGCSHDSSAAVSPMLPWTGESGAEGGREEAREGCGRQGEREKTDGEEGVIRIH